MTGTLDGEVRPGPATSKFRQQGVHVGFVENKREDDDDLGGLLGTGQKKAEESEAKGHRGLTVDTDVLKCEVCRTELLPWQTECPNDGGRGVPPEELPAQEDALLARFLENEAAGNLPDPDEIT